MVRRGEGRTKGGPSLAMRACQPRRSGDDERVSETGALGCGWRLAVTCCTAHARRRFADVAAEPTSRRIVNQHQSPSQVRTGGPSGR